ncbi:NAD-dependent epimerase/dehydratase family protein [Mycobacterium sp.]|uniref:NAD-dependent epimerase/dehydratase family protein n=1 Tax=Mycobacterium sp. TaxID=1785 RepID=UPI003A884B34
MSEQEVVRPAPSFDKRRVFLTGANGFIGRTLAARLRELGGTVAGVDLIADPDNGIEAGSTADPSQWAHALAGADAVVHLAAIVSTVAPVDKAWEVNVLGTKKVIDAAVDAGVSRFVHLSSIAAYGWEFPDHVTETYPTRVTGGVSTYVDTKTNSEQVVFANSHRGMETVVIRPGDVYGPGSVWIREPIAMAKANQLVLPNGGSGVFDMIYVDNLVDGIVLALTTQGISGEIFNITEDQGVSNAAYFGEIASWVGGKFRSVPIGIGLPAVGVAGKALRRLGKRSELGPGMLHMLNREHLVSNEKARKVLGFQPVVSYREGIARCREWAQDENLI